jgi:hypothetical protein
MTMTPSILMLHLAMLGCAKPLFNRDRQKKVLGAPGESLLAKRGPVLKITYEFARGVSIGADAQGGHDHPF